MNKLLEHLGNKLSVYFLLGILSLLMLYYYFGYVPNNNQKLNNHAARLLDNKARSVVEKYNGYANAINSAPISYFSKWFFKLQAPYELFYLEETGKGFSYSVHNSGNNGKGVRTITKQIFEDAARVDEALVPQINGPKDGEDLKDIWKVQGGNYYFTYSPAKKFFNCGKTAPVYLWVNIEGFTANLKSNDFFDDVFLVRDRDRYDCKGTDCAKDQAKFEVHGLDGQILDKSKLGLIQYHFPDTLEVNTGTGIYQQEILGQKYIVYHKLLRLKRGLNVHMVALVSKAKFDRQARQVPVSFMVFCALGALVLVVVFPIVKLFSLNKHERMSAVDARLSIYSVIVTLGLVVILLVGGYFFWGLEANKIDKDLHDYATAIRTEVRNELKAIAEIITNGSEFDARMRPGSTDSIKFNELFVVDDAGNMEELRLSDTARKVRLDVFPVNVGQRNYFKLARAAYHNFQRVDYIPEAINSFASGRGEVAVSSPDPTSKKVRVMTSRFPAVINASIPSPFKFVLMDKAGDIKFHSDWTTVKTENFLSECENDRRIQALLQGDIAEHVGFNYLLQDCWGFLQPIQKGWYVLVYFEEENKRNLAAQVFSLSLITLTITVVFLGLIHLLLRLDYRQPRLLQTKPFYYDWLNPHQQSGGTWVTLGIINFLIFILQVFWLKFGGSTLLSLLFVLTAICASFVVTYTPLTRRDRKHWQRSSFYLIVVFVICCGTFLFASRTMGTRTGYYLLPLIATSLLAVPALFRVTASRFDGMQIRTYPAYKFFLMAWLFVLTVGPSGIFVTEHYTMQKLIRDYDFLLYDVRKFQIKSPLEKNTFIGRDYSAQKVQETFTRYQPKAADVQFYSALPFYVGHEKSVAFNYPPTYVNDTLFISDHYIKAESDSSLIGPGQGKLSKVRPLATFSAEINWVVAGIVLAILILSWALWWALTYIPRKVYFVDYWPVPKEFPRRREGLSAFAREFEHHSQPNHPLHDFDPGQRKEILKEYSAMFRKRHREPQLVYEKAILDLQQAAAVHYQWCWNQCAEEERFYLYDLAEDGVANQSNRDIIEALAKRGLVRLSPKLEIVNVSFGNFVRQAMTTTDLAAWHQRESKEGRWQNVRVLLIIIIVSAFAFLSIAEEGFIGRATALLGSIAIVIPNLITVLGVLSKIFVKGN